jgi:hypothetical protein
MMQLITGVLVRTVRILKALRRNCTWGVAEMRSDSLTSGMRSYPTNALSNAAGLPIAVTMDVQSIKCCRLPTAITAMLVRLPRQSVEATVFWV